MLSVRFLLAGLAAAFLAATAALAAPLEVYGKLPAIEDVALSPSGRSAAFVLTDGEQRMIVVKDLASNQITTRAATGEVKVRRVQWAGEDHLLIVKSVTASPAEILNSRREWLLVFSLDLKTKKVRPLMGDVQWGMNTIFDMPVVRTFRGEPTVFLKGVRFSGGRGVLCLFRVDLDTSKSRLVEEGDSNTQDWIVGPDGEAVAQETYDGRSGRWTLRVHKPSGWRTEATAEAKLDRPYVMGLGRDGASVLYAMADVDGAWAWREARLDDGPEHSQIEMADNQRALRDPQDGRLLGHYALVGDQSNYTFYDDQDDKVWKAVVKAFPGDRVDLASWSADRRRIVVSVDSATEGPAYALVDLDRRDATWLGAVYLGLKAKDIGPRKPIRFRAQDGLELSGYLTLPLGREPLKLPLVVFPHGGPAARDTPGFDWWAQAMASRGYAVLQVNYRGSDGLGAKLLEAGYGEWGRKMQTDLSDGVRFLAAQGTIDPKRICIVGASYGGYAALAGATIDRGVYRCAVSFAGVADLRRQVAYSKARQGIPSERYWARFMGAEDRRDDVLAQYSPALLADQADIPILLVHGQDDTVVPIEQSREMAEALTKAGKPFGFVIQKGEDHWLSRGETRLEMLNATVGFLEKHNPPN